MQRIAIIGGGAAGSAVVGEFLRHAEGRVALTWLVGQRAPGRGVAYATSSEQHLLNVRAANMGLFADDTGALLRFTHARGITAKGSDFLPRSVFGDYVESTLARLLSTHVAGCSIDVHSTEAVAVHPRAAGGYDVRIEDGTEVAVDAVVLAVGALPPVPLPQVDASALGSGRYVLDPWQLPRLAQAPQSVVVLGSGLTAADVILSVATTWPHAQIVALSRRGCLPGVHRAEPGEPYPHQTELIDTLRSRPNVRHWLRATREILASDLPDWRSVIDGLRPVTVELWRSLDSTQRGRFLRHVRWLWELTRHRMPPQTAQAIEQLRDEGRLDLIAGRTRRVDGQSPLALTFRRRDDGTMQTLAADLIIQATGFETLTDGTEHRLLRQMIDTGLVRADPLGLGLDADTDGRPLRADGSATKGVRVIGTLLRSTLWECTALPEIRNAAARLVRELPRELHSSQERASAPARFWSRSSRYIDMAIHQLGA